MLLHFNLEALFGYRDPACRLTAQTMMRIQPLRAILVLAVCLGSILPSPGTASYLTTNQVVIGVTPDVLRAVPGITPESFLQIISG